MAYIGQSIKNGTFTVLDTSGNTYNGSNTTFNLGTQVGSPAQLLVSHDGVVQKPGTDYTLASGGTQITFTTAPASGASIFIVEISGAVGGPMNRDINGDELILDVDGDTSITADTDDQIDFKTGGSDRLKIDSTDVTVSTGNIVFGTASKGVYLGVTSATAANLLDDYEEGTWSPTALQSTSNPTISYTRQMGHYTKIGRLVLASGNIYATGVTNGSGQVRIGGLPFTINSTDNGMEGGISIGYVNGFTSTNSPKAGLPNRNTTYIALITNDGDDARNNLDVQVTNTGTVIDINFNIVYMA